MRVTLLFNKSHFNTGRLGFEDETSQTVPPFIHHCGFIYLFNLTRHTTEDMCIPVDPAHSVPSRSTTEQLATSH